MGTINVTVKQAGPTTSEGIARHHTVLIDRPASKNGEDRGAMGGELLLLALGGCFMSNLLAAIRERDAAISDINVAIAGTTDGPPQRYTAIHMQVSGTYDDRAQFEKLVTIAERACLSANTLKGGVDLTVSVA